jgi:hypothetical protein
MKPHRFPTVVLHCLALLASRAVLLLPLVSIVSLYQLGDDRIIPASSNCDDRFDLFDAVDQNDIARVKQCLGGGLGPDTEVEGGYTIEDYAIVRGRAEILRMFWETRTNSSKHLADGCGR